MLDRILLVALTPLALAGGTASSWLQTQFVSIQGKGFGKTAYLTSAAYKSKPALRIIRGEDGLLHTWVRVNGVPLDMVVDTGASRTILTEDDARKVFLDRSTERNGRIRTLAGERDLRLTQITTAEIAGRHFSHIEAGVLDDAPVSIIGLDWLALMGPITIPAVT